MALFGASYAIASLGCTIGPFLAVVVAGFRTESVASGIGLFLAYAAGMGILVVTGAYVAWYAWYEIRALRGGRVCDPVVDGAARFQAVLAGWLDRLGTTAVAVAFSVLLVTTAVLIRRRRASGPDQARTK